MLGRALVWGISPPSAAPADPAYAAVEWTGATSAYQLGARIPL